jgi:hypothetical protein
VKKAVFFTLMAMVACSVIESSASAQNANGVPGSAAAGQMGNALSDGLTTWQAGENMSNVPTDTVGQSWTTLDSALQAGGAQSKGPRLPVIAPAKSGDLAPNSVNQNPFDSGYFSFGFPQTAASSTKDPYIPPNLPLTSTGSTDLNTADCPYCGQGLSGWGW